MSEATTPVVIPTRVVNINGKPVTFLQGQIPRGDNKGKPFLAPSFAKPGAPQLTEIVELMSTLGQGPIAKKIAKLIRDMSAAASIDAIVKLADGKYDVDTGKFASALLAEVADLDTGTKDQLEADRDVLEAEFNKVFGEAFGNFLSKGLQLPEALTNRLKQLMIRREQLAEKLAKGKRTKKADAAPAAAAPAAAPVPAH